MAPSCTLFLPFVVRTVVAEAVAALGLQKFDPKRKMFSVFRHEAGDTASLADDQTNVVRVASDGFIWVGADAGLSRLDPVTGKFINFSAGGAGLTSVIVNAIAEGRNGTMLFGTDIGVNVYDPGTGGFKAYTILEGMPSNYVMALEADRAGNIWAGTDKGLTSFQPDQLRDNPTPPPVYITELSLFNRKLISGPDSPLKTSAPFARDMSLNYRQSSVGFKFAALN